MDVIDNMVLQMVLPILQNPILLLIKITVYNFLIVQINF